MDDGVEGVGSGRIGLERGEEVVEGTFDVVDSEGGLDAFRGGIQRREEVVILADLDVWRGARGRQGM